MASYDARKAGRQNAGRPPSLEFTSVTGAAQNTNVAVADRLANSIFGEDMILNVFDTSTSPWTDLRAKFNVTSTGNIQNNTDSSGSGHTLLVVWLKFHLTGQG